MSEQAGKKLVRLLPLPTIKDLMQLYKVKAIRKLSQNFLLDENLNHKIVKSAGKIKKADVCEVGPGPGNITRSIIHKGAEKIILVEKDQQFLPTLQMLRDASPAPIDIIHGDILRYNLEGKFSENKRKAWEDDCPDIHIIGNLPFNIATPLIVRWLRDISEKKNAWTYGRVPMTLTFQKEVAERMIAPVMTAQRCRLSVMCQNWCTIEYKFTISGRSFLPKAKVDVGVVHLIPHKVPIIPLPFDLVEKVVKSLFSSRQKYCVKTLSFLFPRAQAHLAEEMLKVAEIEPFSRPLQLSVEEIGKLCYLYKDIIEKNPSLKHYDQKKKDDYWLTREEDELHKISEWQNRQIQDNFY